jgi:hypothetical protein
MMKKLILSILLGLVIAGNLLAMEPVSASGSFGQVPVEDVVTTQV